jgi:hypothetical protein
MVSARERARAQLDHVVVGIRALDEGIAAFERLTGVTAVKGGQHPDRGTENALVSLGTGRYLELIGPRQDAAPTPDLDVMRSLDGLTVIDWAVGVNDLDAARQAVAGTGITIGPGTPGSRVLPSGATLKWSTAAVAAPQIATAPFFIRWEPSTPHPSTTSPQGCTLTSMEIYDPAATGLSRALNALRVSGITVRRGDARIRVNLKCGEKSVILGSR